MEVAKMVSRASLFFCYDEHIERVGADENFILERVVDRGVRSEYAKLFSIKKSDTLIFAELRAEVDGLPLAKEFKV